MLEIDLTVNSVNPDTGTVILLVEGSDRARVKLKLPGVPAEVLGRFEPGKKLCLELYDPAEGELGVDAERDPATGDESGEDCTDASERAANDELGRVHPALASTEPVGPDSFGGEDFPSDA